MSYKNFVKTIKRETGQDINTPRLQKPGYNQYQGDIAYIKRELATTVQGMIVKATKLDEQAMLKTAIKVLIQCQHPNKTDYYTNDLVAMYHICDDCGKQIKEEN